MTLQVRFRVSLALAAVLLLAACGGDSPAPASAQEFAAAIRPDAPRSDRLRALATGGGATASPAASISNAQLFQWARLTYPDLFPGTPTSLTVPYQGKVFDVQSFPNGNYIGVADGVAYGLGPFTGGNLQNFGAVQQFADLVCSRVNCAPTDGSGGTGGTGSLNGCMRGFSEAMRTGNTSRVVYLVSSLAAPNVSDEITTDSVVNGPATFEGVAATKVTDTISSLQMAAAGVTTTAVGYHIATGNDLTRTLGSEVSTTFQGLTDRVTSVYQAPAPVNDEFTLAVGASLTKGDTMTSTLVLQSLPGPIAPTTTTSRITHTYEGREAVLVQGRTWNTCRYRSTTPDSPGYRLTWHIVGIGVVAKGESYTDGAALQDRMELKSAILNGAPL